MKIITTIALQALIAISASTYAANNTASGPNLADNQPTTDTNAAKHGFKCPKCGETINFYNRHKQKTDSKQPDLEAKIASIIEDLSSEQREKIHDITVQSRQALNRYRAQRKAVHDSIHTLLRITGDQSETLFPLFDKSAQIRAEIDKELYLVRQRISAALTEEQLHKLHEKMTSEPQQTKKAANNKHTHKGKKKHKNRQHSQN